MGSAFTTYLFQIEKIPGAGDKNPKNQPEPILPV
jgi:hypothetical protein